MDRIKSNPRLPISSTPEGSPGTSGSLDSHNESGMDCEIKRIDSMGSERKAPTNPPSSWSADPN